jgi:hypothetical protein
VRLLWIDHLWAQTNPQKKIAPIKRRQSIFAPLEKERINRRLGRSVPGARLVSPRPTRRIFDPGSKTSAAFVITKFIALGGAAANTTGEEYGQSDRSTRTPSGCAPLIPSLWVLAGARTSLGRLTRHCDKLAPSHPCGRPPYSFGPGDASRASMQTPS